MLQDRVSCSLSSSKISRCVLFLSLFCFFLLTMHASANRLQRVPNPGPSPAPEPKPCPSPGPNPAPATTKRTHNTTFPAIFAFGDSILDTGNNDYILTLIKANFLPYGMNFPDKVPTGRFCNGKIPSDFIADYIGVKPVVPAYLRPGLTQEDLLTGVSFASGGSGYDPLTPIVVVITSLL